MLAGKVHISIITAPGRLCCEDNRTVANASHSCSPGYSSLKSHSYWLNSLLLKITLEMVSTDKSLSMQRACMARRMHIAVDRGCSVQFSTKSVMTYVALPAPYVTLSPFSSLVPRPHPLTRRNSLVNQVEFLGLVHAFATM